MSDRLKINLYLSQILTDSVGLLLVGDFDFISKKMNVSITKIGYKGYDSRSVIFLQGKYASSIKIYSISKVLNKIVTVFPFVTGTFFFDGFFCQHIARSFTISPGNPDTHI